MPAQRFAPRRRTLIWLLGVTSVAAAVYLSTLAPSITWAHYGADGGDLAAAVATGGIPHPTGYPTYILLGRLFARLPWGDLAFRLNLMSATWAALTVGVVYLIVLRTLHMFGDRDGDPHRPLLAAVGALAFAFSPLFWSQALIVEVYTLHAFFVALVTYLVLRWMEQPALWRLSATALAMGLGLGNHLTLVLLGPPILVLLWHRRGHLPATPGPIALVLAPFLLGLTVYLYLPLRAVRYPPVNWGDPQTVDRFLWLVSGRAYQRYFFALPLRYLPDRLGAWSRLLRQQFGWLGLLAALVGLSWLWERARAFALATLLLFLGCSVYALAYDTGDSHVYLIPAYLACGVWLAWGLQWVRAQLRDLGSPRTRALSIAALALLLVLPSLLTNFRALDLSADRQARDFGQGAMATLAPDALVISWTDPHTFTLWYYRYAVERRRDVAVVDAELLRYDWYRRTVARVHGDLAPAMAALSPTAGPLRTADARALALIQHTLHRRPVYLTSPIETIDARHHLSPQGPLYRVLESTSHRQNIEQICVHPENLRPIQTRSPSAFILEICVPSNSPHNQSQELPTSGIKLSPQTKSSPHGIIMAPRFGVRLKWLWVGNGRSKGRRAL